MTTGLQRLRRLAGGRALDSAGMLIVYVVLFVGASMIVPNFATARNMAGLALSVSAVGMVACTMLFCMVSGDFDLSVEAVVAASGVLAAVVITSTHSVLLGVLAGTLAGGLVGVVNGFVIARLGINALITTLATMQIVRGLGLIISGGSAVGISEMAFFSLGNSAFLGVPTPVWITLACFGIFGFLLHRTTFGRHALAIGGNREAARLAGIGVVSRRIMIFTVQGLVAGLAGVILASQMTSGQPNSFAGFSLSVISACVLGGVALSGGVGTMVGVVVGVLIMGTVQNIMDLRNLPSFYQYVVRGSILLAAVLFDRYRGRSRAQA